MLGHTEDSPGFARNLTYIVHADITDIHPDGVVRHEKFTSFCYAGNLPGFCMNVNKHGFVFTMNLVDPVGIRPYKTRERIIFSLNIVKIFKIIIIFSSSFSDESSAFREQFRRSDDNPS